MRTGMLPGAPKTTAVTDAVPVNVLIKNGVRTGTAPLQEEYQIVSYVKLTAGEGSYRKINLMHSRCLRNVTDLKPCSTVLKGMKKTA